MVGMLSPALLQDPIECERLADSYWADGTFSRQQLSYPKVGEAIAPELLAHWRVWMTERAPTEKTYFGAWALIDDGIFWKNLVAHIGNDVVIGRGLEHAGMLGNMAAFDAASMASIEQYGRKVFERTLSTGPKYGYQWLQTAIVHPNVVLRMRELGVWTQEQVSSLAMAYTVDGTAFAPGILNADPHNRKLYGFAREFLEDWCLKSLKQLGWGADEQSHFLGHFIQQVNVELWTPEFAQKCAPHLHPDVDVGMLKLALGFSFEQSMWQPWSTMPATELTNVYSTIYNIGQAFERGEHPWVPRQSDHHGIRMLMELNPPRSCMGLYQLGCQSKRIALGTMHALDSIPLPSLER